MRKLLSGGLVFAGIVSAPAAISKMQQFSQRPVLADYTADSRLPALRDFLERADCPVAEHAAVFLQAADDYDLDWRLLPSLSFIESTGGKMARNNNVFGWNNGRTAFTSVPAGIHAVGYQLANGAYYRDKNLDGVLWAYNPREGYGAKVKWVMRRISPSE